MSKTKKQLSSVEILRNIGGVLVDTEKKKFGAKEWSFPLNNGIISTLESIWGINRNNLKILHDRLHLPERLLKNAKIVRPPNGLVVVDLCCGKGGDLRKYVRNQASVVVGVDNENNLLNDLEDSALNRWIGIKGSSHSLNTDTCFVLADCRQPLFDTFTEMGLKLEADLVSCFFALHYFFNHEKEARRFTCSC